MNKVITVGRFAKVWHESGKNFIFKVSVKRNYKNKETGKYDWDNITFMCYNEGAIKFLENYVNDGDIVSVEGHIHTYAKEADGNKTYHEDKVCDAIRLVAKAGSSEGAVIAEEKITAAEAVETDDFVEADIDDDDVPF